MGLGSSNFCEPAVAIFRMGSPFSPFYRLEHLRGPAASSRNQLQDLRLRAGESTTFTPPFKTGVVVQDTGSNKHNDEKNTAEKWSINNNGKGKAASLRDKTAV